MYRARRTTCRPLQSIPYILRRRFSSSTSLKWLMFSDIHFSTNNLPSIHHTTDWILSVLKDPAHNIQRVLILGDLLTARSQQTLPVLSACHRFVNDISTIVPSVDIIVGNHDMHLKHSRQITALDAFDSMNLQPYIRIHRELHAATVDDRPMLFLPYHEQQAQIEQYVQQYVKQDPAKAAHTVAVAHLSINGAITQRSANANMHYNGLTGPQPFAPLARTYTGHFHCPQIIKQAASVQQQHTDELHGSITYLGSPLQLQWGDISDTQKGVTLLDPHTLQQQLLLNPHAVKYIALKLDDVPKASPQHVAGKHIMLTMHDDDAHKLTRHTYAYARDLLLDLGALAVRHDKSPIFAPATKHGVAVGQSPAGSNDTARIHVANQADVAPTRQPVDMVSDFLQHVTLGGKLKQQADALTTLGQHIIKAAERSSVQANATIGQSQAYTTLLSKSAEREHSASDTNATSAARVFTAQPTSITVENFLGVRGRLELDLQQLPLGITLLVGLNGSGKSTLLEAFSYAQFGRTLRSNMTVNDVVNDREGKNCCVRLNFSNGYAIERFRDYTEKGGNGLAVYLNDQRVEHYDKADQRTAQQTLEQELIGIDFDTYSKTVVLGNDATGFLTATANQRREIIESLLGLSVFDQYMELTKAMRQQIDTERQQLENQRNSFQQVVQLTQQRVQRLTGQLKQLQDELADLEQTSQTGADDGEQQTDHRKLEQQLQAAQADVQRLQPQVESARVAHAYHTSMQQYLGQRNATQQRVQQLELLLERLGLQLAEAQRVLHQQSTSQYLQQGMQKTEDVRDWLHEHFHQYSDQEKQLSSALKDFTHVAETLQDDDKTSTSTNRQPAAQQSTADNERAIVKATDELAKCQLQLQTLEDQHRTQLETTASQHSTSTAQMLQLAAKYPPRVCEQLTTQLLDLNALVSRLRVKQDAVNQPSQQQLDAQRQLQLKAIKQNDITTYEQLLHSEQQMLEQSEQQVSAVDQQLQQLEEHDSLFEFWEAAFGRRGKLTFRSHVLDQHLHQLNQVMSQVLQVLYEEHGHAALHTAATSVSSSLLNQLGLDDGSETAILDSSLRTNPQFAYGKRSSGERRRFDLALFFSLVHLAQQQSRYRSKYLLIDEVFDTLDTAGQQAVLRWLQTLLTPAGQSSAGSIDRAFVVTHSQSVVDDEYSGVNILRAEMTRRGTRFVSQSGEAVGTASTPGASSTKSKRSTTAN